MSISLFGVLGMTWLFPVISSFLWRAAGGGPSRVRETFEKDSACSVAVLIPAHNESAKLSFTVESIRQAIAHVQHRLPGLRVRIIVAADGCSDSTAAVARRCGAEVVELVERHGKWKALARLVNEADGADWVALADCGIVWGRDLLGRVLPVCAQEDVIGVAPAYCNPRGGILETLLWYFERHLKRIEGEAGGPVSMHGATVFYRRRELCQALHEIGTDEDWLNDDVVVPLVMRARHPDKRIPFLADVVVSEHPLASDGHTVCNREMVRRRRMALGNVQWISKLYPRVWRSNQLVGLLALRRVFRLFWAYWGLALCAVAALTWMRFLEPANVFSTGGLLLLAAVLFSFLFVGSLRRILDAALASLMAPYYLLFRHWRVEGAVWR